MATKGDEDLYPIAVLIEELKNENTQKRLNSIRNLDKIAVALGPDRTRNELIPFLTESIDDDDEVLLALAEELGRFVAFVGGEAHAHCLLQPLETLAGVEETVVREKTVESLLLVGESFADEQFGSHYIDMLKRLCTGDWFTSRVSSCGLFAIAYDKVRDAGVREMLRSQFNTLCRDETPMVRRAAASSIGKLAKHLEPEYLTSELMAMFAHLCGDEQDSVRILAVETCAVLAQILPEEEATTHIVPIVRTFGEDKSWRVRYMVAGQLCELAAALEVVLLSDLVPIFVHMLQDTEAEVRTVVAHHMSKFCKNVPREVVETKVLECVSVLATDSSQHVRAALAQDVLNLAPLLEKDLTIAKLLPLYLQLLRDESSEVRLNVISRLEVVSGVIGVEQLSHSLLPAVMELAEDKQWRVRLAVIDYMPLMAKELGQEFFDIQLSELCLSWLGDSVFSIREATTKALPKLARVFGDDWTVAKIVPRIIDMYKGDSYTHRLTAFFAINELAAADIKLGVFEELLPMVLAAAKDDPVPNVVFNAAKTIGLLIPKLDASTVGTKIKPLLTGLCSHTDNEVKYFAEQALALC